MKKIKIAATLLALSVVGNLMLCSCSKTDPTETETETVPEITEETLPTETETEETTTESTNEMPQLSFNTDYEEIKLDGIEEHHVVTTDYCYLESEKYFLLMEAGIELPGDFADNLDRVIDELETELGMELMTPDYEYSMAGIINISVYYDGFNPWSDWKLGTKLPIFILIDSEAKGWVPCGDSECVIAIDYGLYSDDSWDKASPNFRYTFDRPEYVDYSVFAHEITHAITSRNCEMNSIMTEGIASYMERNIIDELADDYPAFAVVKENRYLYDYGIPEAVNADNSERLFTEAYEENQGPAGCSEYVHGRYLCQFLFEQYGPGFLVQYADKVKTYPFENHYGYFTEAEKTYFTKAMKDAFGDDIFERFGDWCVENNVLQELNGVFPIPD